MRRKVTLQDIANKLRMSRTTISLALRNHPRISQATKERIHHLARKIGYEPDRVARSLATGRSNLIGVVIPDSSNHYYAEVLRGIEEAARAAEYHAILANGSYSLEEEANRIRELLSLRVAGIIAAPAFKSERPRLDPFWRRLSDERVPLVLLNRQLIPPIFHQVSDDNEAGVRMAVAALASLGHRRVAYITAKPETVPARQRLVAFRRLARENDFDDNPRLFECSEFGSRGGYDACRRLWSSLKRKPTAIMTLSDTEALGALRHLLEQNVRVPQEVSIMGFGGFDLSLYSAVSLSTVSTPRREAGKQAVKLLIDVINRRPSLPQNIVLPVHLVLRESVGSAPGQTH